MKAPTTLICILIFIWVTSASALNCKRKPNPCELCHKRKIGQYNLCEGAKVTKLKCAAGTKCVKAGKCKIECELIPTTTTTTTTTTTPRPGSKGVGCGPPDCLYEKKEIPGGLDVSDTPMFVYMSFDDAMTVTSYNKYYNLFLNPALQRHNPNGCPHRATYFVSDEYTDYAKVRTLYDAGHEIASHSINHITMKFLPKADQKYEMSGQRDIIVEKAGIPAQAVRGSRAPYLDIGGDRFYDMLHEEHFWYDASITYRTDPPIWPHTMHAGTINYCDKPSQECPGLAHPLWQVPLNVYMDKRKSPVCGMLDGCRPATANDTFDLIWRNFQRHYNAPHRPPFGLNLHSAWFIGYSHTLDGFKMFLDKITTMDDVWVAPICDIIEWIKTPVGLSSLNASDHFQC